MNFTQQAKKVKKLIKGHHPIRLLDALFGYMNIKSVDKTEALSRQPWLIMLIIKWNFLENDFRHPITKTLNEQKFNRILKSAHALGRKVRMPGDGRHVMNFMRNMAFQQLIYQQDASIISIASNQLLFSALPSNSKIHKRFEQLTGTSILVFSQCTVMLFNLFSKQNTLTIQNLIGIFEIIGESEVRLSDVEKTLDTLSVNLHDVGNTLREKNRAKGTYSEWYEQSPFIEFPLIKHDGKYTCVNIHIFFRCIEGFVYNRLKQENPTEFMAHFGKVFESHLTKGLDFCGCNYSIEKDLIKEIPKNVPAIDYIVREPECNIYIDAKAVELPYLGKVSDDPAIIIGKVKTSALKALQQANGYNAHLQKNGSKHVEYKKLNYLLVVTYKELYLSNGRVFYESIAKNSIDRIIDKLDQETLLPLENVYFISLDAFELMCSVIQQNELTISSILEQAKKDDLNPRTMKFDFLQHLQSLEGKLLRPKYLDAPLEELTAFIKHKIM